MIGMDERKSGTCSLSQQSPTFLAPGTGFEEGSFSGVGLGGWGVVQAVTQAMGSHGERQMKLRPQLTSCCAPRS